MRGKGMVKALEGKLYEEWLPSFGLFILEESEKRPHRSLQHSHKGNLSVSSEGQVPISPLEETI